MNKKLIYLLIIVAGCSVASYVYASNTIISDTSVSTPKVNTVNVVASGDVNATRLFQNGQQVTNGGGGGVTPLTKLITWTNSTNVTVSTDNSNPQVLAEWKIQFTKPQNQSELVYELVDLSVYEHQISNFHTSTISLEDSIDGITWNGIASGGFGSSTTDQNLVILSNTDLTGLKIPSQTYYFRISASISSEGIDSFAVDNELAKFQIFGDVDDATVTRLIG